MPPMNNKPNSFAQPVQGIPMGQAHGSPQGYGPPQGYPPQKTAAPVPYQGTPGTPNGNYGQMESGGGAAQGWGDWQPMDPHCGEAVTGTPIYPDVPQQQGRNQRFVMQGWKDLPCAIGFLLAFMGSFVLFFLAMGKDDALDFDINEPAIKTPLYSYYESASNKDEDDSALTGNIGIWIPVACVTAVIIGCAFLVAMRAFPKQFIIFSNVMSCVMFLALAVYTMNIWLGLFGLFFVAWLWCVRHRIPFASALLEASITIVFEYKAVLFTALFSLVVGLAYVFAMMVAMKPNLAVHQDTYDYIGYNSSRCCSDAYGNGCSGYVSAEQCMASCDYASKCVTKTSKHVEDGNTGLLLVIIFVMFWAFQVLQGVVHVTTCGVVATWFFFKATQMPRNPTMKSFRRAMTWSFGSICFGSLIVAILKMIKLLIRMMDNDNYPALKCIILWCLDCIDGLMQYFNKWAFAQIAIYGKSFMEAAKATWRMLKDGSIWGGIIADCLVDTALDMCQMIGALAIGVFCGVIAKSLMIGLLTAYISFSILQTLMGTVESAIVTIFICTSEAREQLRHVNPQLYNVFQRRCAGQHYFE